MSVLEQEGRGAEARTAKILATTLERDTVDVAGALTRLQRDGLVAKVEDASVEEDVWAVVDQDA